MKKLSDLVYYQETLNKLSTTNTIRLVNAELEQFIYLTKSSDLISNLSAINHSLEEFNETFVKIKQDLKLTIEQEEKPLFQLSYQLHEEFPKFLPDHILDLRLNVHEEVKDIIRTRLKFYVGWQHAAMFIRPAKENFITQLLSAEPLYVLDHSYDLLAPTIDSFNDVYKNRVRQYTIDDINNQVYFEHIPDGQFGICVAFMYFDFKPLQVIKQYFIELYQKLKPGGTLAITFNNCDYAGAVKYAEVGWRCYTPGYLVKELAHSAGFEINYEWHEPQGAITWIELRKPGVLTSTRGGQILARIMPK